MISQTDLRTAIARLEQGDWRAAHEIVQKDEDSPLACWAHGIVHLMEGDLPNARYWYAQAKRPLPPQFTVENELRALRAALGKGD